jgi:threonine dehydrogenase-like Zn-dependent dehydrogenase
MLRVPLADGTLVAMRNVPSEDLIPSLLAVSDVIGTGWFAANAANVKPGMTVVVVGDGAVGLLGVLSAKADHRDEPSRATAEARARVRRDRHRDGAR